VEGDLNLQEIFKLVPIPKKTSSSIVHSKSFKKLKNHEKNEEKKRIPRVNLTFSHFNHTFLILDPQIGPQAFKQSFIP
jgi:hypothetical protein